MAGHMEFEFNIRGEAAGRKSQGSPFNLLVLGNFSGGANPAPGSFEQSLAKHRIVKVDLDNLNELWSIFSPALTFQAGSATIEFSPADIEDFHPDQLYRSLPIFTELRETRRQLNDPATSQATLDSLLSDEIPASEKGTTDPEQMLHGEGDEDAGAMFERLLGKPGGQTAVQRPASSDDAKLDSFIRGLVAPHVVHQPHPQVETAIDSVDLATAQLMRELLHQPDFQALEASWRSLFDLVSELELDENLQLYVCDFRKADLLAALPDPGMSLQDSALFQLLVDRRRQAADDTPWTVIAGDYYFGPGPEDIALLTALGAAAAANGGVFLGGAHPDILGCKTAAELADVKYWSAGDENNSLWQSLRSSPVSDRIGLALPRLLLRLPYGEHSEEIDTFPFEEMPQRKHEQYLWSNPCYACSRLLAQSFTREGWRMQPGDHVDLGYLPAHHYQEDGESLLQPCAELLLSESTMVAMLEQGLMPLVSYRNQNTAVLGRFQSIASPAAALAGPWK
jgi:type VI secretion system protein ImpC